MMNGLIGITTSIATTAAIGVARAGAAAVTGGHRAPIRTRRIVVRQNADEAIAILKRALQSERDLRGQLERENARLREMVEVAEIVIDELQQPAG